MKCDPKYKFMRERLLSDLSAVGVPVDLFELHVKDYSATYYGCYRTKTNRIYLYAYEDKECTTPYSYEHMLDTAVHEAVHAIQWHDPNYVRFKGVMHDEEFSVMYSKYSSKLRKRSYEESKVKSKEISFSRKYGVQQNPVQHLDRSSKRADLGVASCTNSRVLRVACRRKE